MENPDLTAPGVINAVTNINEYRSRPYSETFNLGATGLRGWIYIDIKNPRAGTHGFLTATSRQILVTVAEAPGNAVLELNDVILGVTAESTEAVPLFSGDSRKAFGTAIARAEVALANGEPNSLRVKRWRSGVTTDVNFPMAPMKAYSATAPLACPKSAEILAGARIKLVNELLDDLWFLSTSYHGAIDALALLAAVAPGDDDYDAIQIQLKSYAISVAARRVVYDGEEWWHTPSMNLFLCEYYLRCLADSIMPNASILRGINRYTIAMAKGQSRFGTFNTVVLLINLGDDVLSFSGTNNSTGRNKVT